SLRTEASSLHARHADLAQQLLQRLVVLLGQDLGRRHDRGLVAIGDRLDRRRGRHRRLAAADITLEQARHWRWATYIVKNLLERAHLGAGQVERQLAEKLFVSLLLELQRVATLALPDQLALQHAQLDEQKLIEAQPPARLLERANVGWKVHLSQRLRQRHQVGTLAHAQRQVVLHH